MAPQRNVRPRLTRAGTLSAIGIAWGREAGQQELWVKFGIVDDRTGSTVAIDRVFGLTFQEMLPKIAERVRAQRVAPTPASDATLDAAVKGQVLFSE